MVIFHSLFHVHILKCPVCRSGTLPSIVIWCVQFPKSSFQLYKGPFNLPVRSWDRRVAYGSYHSGLVGGVLPPLVYLPTQHKPANIGNNCWSIISRTTWFWQVKFKSHTSINKSKVMSSSQIDAFVSDRCSCNDCC